MVEERGRHAIAVLPVDADITADVAYQASGCCVVEYVVLWLCQLLCCGCVSWLTYASCFTQRYLSPDVNTEVSDNMFQKDIVVIFFLYLNS